MIFIIHNNICLFFNVSYVVIFPCSSEVIANYLVILLLWNGDGDGNSDESNKLLLNNPGDSVLALWLMTWCESSRGNGPPGESKTQFVLSKWIIFFSLTGDETRMGAWGIVQWTMDLVTQPIEELLEWPILIIICENTSFCWCWPCSWFGGQPTTILPLECKDHWLWV